MIKCDVCKKEFEERDIYAFYPEDSSYICKECFRKNNGQKGKQIKEEK